MQSAVDGRVVRDDTVWRRVIAGRAIVPGDAEGVALVTSEALSFWGGFDFNTGTIIDAHHPLVGARGRAASWRCRSARDHRPRPAVLLEAVRAGTAPAAILTTGVDSFFALASIVADVMYGKSFPVDRAWSPPSFATLRNRMRLVVRSGAIRLT